MKNMICFFFEDNVLMWKTLYTFDKSKENNHIRYKEETRGDGYEPCQEERLVKVVEDIDDNIVVGGGV